MTQQDYTNPSTVNSMDTLNNDNASDTQALTDLLNTIDHAAAELSTIQADEDAQIEAAIHEGEIAVANFNAQLDREEQEMQQAILDDSQE